MFHTAVLSFLWFGWVEEVEGSSLGEVSVVGFLFFFFDE